MAEHHVKHLGPMTEICYCAAAEHLNAALLGGAGAPAWAEREVQEYSFTKQVKCSDRVPGSASLSGEYEDGWECVYSMPPEQQARNRDWLLEHMGTEFEFVGLMSRLDEFMVLLWYAWETKMDKALTSELATYNRDFFVEPCTMFESNVYQKIKIEEENADGRREREALEGKLRARNPLDLSLYAAVEELFEKQVQWADAQPELAQWMEKARNGQLKKCKGKVKSQDDAVWSSSGRKTGREKGGWKPSA